MPHNNDRNDHGKKFTDTTDNSDYQDMYDNVKTQAKDALGNVKNRAEDLYSSAKDKAEDLYSSARDLTKDSFEKAKANAIDFEENVIAYVKENPVKAVGMGILGGLLIAYLLKKD